MSWWKHKLGTVDGSPNNAFAVQVQTIPNGTQAIARLKAYEYVEHESGNWYQASWQIIEGEFKGLQVRQKMPVFDDNENKSYRALNMMMLLNKLAGFEPQHDKQPTRQDLNSVVGLIAGIIIQQWHMDNKSGNWISEVHDSKGFEVKTGTLTSAPAETISAGMPDLQLMNDLNLVPNYDAPPSPNYIDKGLESPLHRALRERDAQTAKGAVSPHANTMIPGFNDDITF